MNDITSILPPLLTPPLNTFRICEYPSTIQYLTSAWKAALPALPTLPYPTHEKKKENKKVHNTESVKSLYSTYLTLYTHTFIHKVQYIHTYILYITSGMFHMHSYLPTYLLTYQGINISEKQTPT